MACPFLSFLIQGVRKCFFQIATFMPSPAEARTRALREENHESWRSLLNINEQKMLNR